MQETTITTEKASSLQPSRKGLQRLDRFISSQLSDMSRNDVRELLKKGKVTVNGVITKKYDFKVSSERDKVTADGVSICYREHIYIMLNKPQGVVCSTRDGLSPTVLSLVPPELMRKGLFPAGRLDKDTEGFVLITDDGEFAHRILSPKHHVPKVYFVRLEADYNDDYEQKFREGMTLKSGEKCLPAEFYKGKESNECYVVICEGMFHQVKKMFEVFGNKVVYLKRLAIGGIRLDENLALGECKEIMHKNVENILEPLNLKELIC